MSRILAVAVAIIALGSMALTVEAGLPRHRVVVAYPVASVQTAVQPQAAYQTSAVVSIPQPLMAAKPVAARVVVSQAVVQRPVAVYSAAVQVPVATSFGAVTDGRSRFVQRSRHTVRNYATTTVVPASADGTCSCGDPNCNCGR